MKKIISIIISITLFISFLPVYATDNTSEIKYPDEGSELGYLFSLKSEAELSFNADDYEGIEVVSKMANIYYADTIAHIKAIDSIVGVDMVVENCELSTTEPIYDNTFMSLFSEENDFIDTNTYEVSDNLTNIDELIETGSIAKENELYLNDPFYDQMWHYDSIKAHSFRDNGITGEGVKVGIIDTGLTKELEKFSGFCDFDTIDIKNGINICAKIDNMDDLLYDTSDNYYHGTSVASIICAKANNNYGIAGLMDECTIVPYKVEDSRCSTTANSLLSIIIAIDVAYQDGCDVVNISQGTDANLGNKYIDMLNVAFDKAIKNGMIVVAASGNSGDEDNHIEYPAGCDNVIGVGAVRPNCEREEVCIDSITGLLKPESEATLDDEFGDRYIRNTIKNLNDNDYVKLELSTANESVFVCAPGLNIPAVNCRSTAIRPFTSFLGTSSATPIVASAAIGVKQMRPYVDTNMFKEILKETAVDLEDEGYDINTGYGMVNFERIYDYVSQMPETAPEKTPDVAIDFENEQLMGFELNKEYTVNGKEVFVSEDGTLPIDEQWFGTTISIVKKASSAAYTDSEPQELVIPARPETPMIELSEDNTIKNTDLNVWYKEENSDVWQLAVTSENSTIELKQGKYMFYVKSTSDSFASKPITLVVTFPEEKPDIETSVSYDKETGICTYTATNNTSKAINAIGIIAVYDKNSVLKHLETLEIFPTGEISNTLDFSLSDSDTVKWLVWDSFQSMKPLNKIKLSDYTAPSGEVE